MLIQEAHRLKQELEESPADETASPLFQAREKAGVGELRFRVQKRVSKEPHYNSPQHLTQRSNWIILDRLKIEFGGILLQERRSLTKQTTCGTTLISTTADVRIKLRIQTSQVLRCVD